ncbi:hypothetical protein 015DV002_66 [Bacillus phage 015DV002]|nr:hypothetical protein 015DV002_66 [Bacillus phage 015DV002]QQO41297.1 hypothetical protein 015DV004_81 [Bacillus phage 015DV004]
MREPKELWGADLFKEYHRLYSKNEVLSDVYYKLKSVLDSDHPLIKEVDTWWDHYQREIKGLRYTKYKEVGVRVANRTIRFDEK